MTKQEFIEKLCNGLSGLPCSDVEERIIFYSEMIDDRMEEGFSEEDAVAAIGDVDAIIAEIVAEYPLIKLVRERIKPKRSLAAWEIVLLSVGSPVWVSLVIAAIASFLAIYVSVWAIVVSFWAVFGAFVGSVLGGALGAAVLIYSGNVVSAIGLLAVACVLAGVAIYSFYGCKYLTRTCILLSKKMAIGVKKLFVYKGEKS